MLRPIISAFNLMQISDINLIYKSSLKSNNSLITKTSVHTLVPSVLLFGQSDDLEAFLLKDFIYLSHWVHAELEIESDIF